MIIIALPITLFSLLWEPMVQTFLAQIMGSYLSKKLNTDIKINSLLITPLLDVKINDLLIKDLKQDTLFYTKKLVADIGKPNRKQKIFRIRKISFNDAQLYLIKYEGDSVYNFDFLFDYLTPDQEKSTSDDTIRSDWNVTFSAFDLKDIRFRFVDENKKRRPGGMDYGNLDIWVDDLELHSVLINKDTFDVNIDELVCRDHCGFEVNGLSGQFRVSPAFLIADNLKVKTPRSDISLDFSFLYDNWKAYINFEHKVNISARIKPSVLNLKDIGYFARPLLVMDNEIRIGGIARGKVNNLRARKFRITFGEATRFYGNISMNGLPDVSETFIHLSVNNLELLKSDIEKFAIPGKINYVQIPEVLQAFGLMKIKGNFVGFYNDFVSDAIFETDIGSFTTDVVLKPELPEDINYVGKVTAHHFNIGKFLKIPEFIGNLNLKARINGHGIHSETVEVEMKGIVDSLDFRGNNFNKINISGKFAEKKYNGHFVIEDELLKMKFDGMMDFGRETPVFDFVADIHNARLYDLNLLDRDPQISLSTKLWCNFIGNNLDDLEGRINIDNTTYTESEKEFILDHFSLITLKDTGNYKKIMLSSDVIDAIIKGNFKFADLYPSCLLFLDRYMSTDYLGIYSVPDNIPAQSLEYEITLHNTADLCNIFYPELMVAENTILQGRYNTEENIIDLSGSSPLISYFGIKIRDWEINMESPGPLILSMNAGRIDLKDYDQKDTLKFGIDSLRFIVQLNNDSIAYSIDWDDIDTVDKNKGEISGYFAFVDTMKNIASISHAEVILNDSLWIISPGNYISLDSSSITIRDIEFIGGEQKLGIDGIVSKDPADTMKICFKKWQISNFDIIINNDNLDFDGVINGDVKFSGLYNTPNIFSDIKIKDLYFNNVILGDAFLKSCWEPKHHSVFLDAEIIYSGNVGTSKTLDVQGYYYPERTNQNFDIDITLENYKLKTLGPFVSSIFSKLDGVTSGKLKLDGTISKPYLNGKLKLMRTDFVIGYLNTKYSFAHEVEFNKKEISFDNVTVYDNLGNTALCHGKISHNYFKDFRIDLEIKANDFICLNTNRYQNDIFYGNAVASGLVNIFGPFNDITINVNADTKKGTDVFIPLGSSIDVSQNDYIIFVNTGEDTTEIKKPAPSVIGLTLKLVLDVSDDAEIQIFLPEQMGNINARGNGKIRIDLSNAGEFTINGDYFISQGNFLLTIQNLIRKKFEILRGGKISFTGNPYNADIMIRALYKVKTSITGLSNTLDELYAGQRVNVDCILGLRDKLTNPDIFFSIKFPNLEEEIKQNIFAILDTTDEALMNQQMISLLILNSFNYNTTASLGASSFNLISNQLSNWLSQISRDFDVGINYRPGDELTEDQIQVSLSTQLFDDRLLIDGDVGVSSGDNSQNASNIVGDVYIEYKLRPDGRVRLKSFNRSNNINYLEDIAPYTQGVGIFYRKEFNRFNEIFQRKKRKQKKN